MQNGYIMKYTLSIILFLAFIWIANGEELYNTEKSSPLWWEHISESDSLDKLASERIVIVTNRAYRKNNSDSVLFPNKYNNGKQIHYIVATKINLNWSLTYYDNLSDAIDQINDGRNFVYFVHGNGKTFTETLHRSANIARRYNVNMISFDWPSEYKLVTKSHKIAEKSATEFYTITKQLKAYKQERFNQTQTLNLFMHSLGNYILIKDIVNNSADLYLTHGFFTNIILNAPAISTKGHVQILEQLTDYSNIYILRNENDFALRSVKVFSMTQMLGATAKGPYANSVSYIQFGHITGNDHTYFLGFHDYEHENHNLFKIYNTLLNGISPRFDNENMFRLVDNSEYYIQ